MLERIQAFAALLRQNRVRVSTGEVLDAVNAAAAVGLARGDDFRAALEGTLVKRTLDRHVFAELFDLYFLAAGEAAARLAGTPLAQLLREAGLGEDAIAALLAQLAPSIARLSPAARAAAGVGDLDVAALLAAAGVALEGVRLTSPLQVGYYAHRALAEMDVAGAERDLDALAADNAALRAAWQKNVAALRAAVRAHIQGQFEQQNVDFAAAFRARTLSEKPFTQLAEDEVARLRIEVQRLARKLRSQAVPRPARRRGRMDVRRTMRRSVDGIPFDLRYRRKRVHKPRLLVLCDISDSVKNVARFMLELVYLLGERFERVRSFVFVAQVGETTELFRRMDIDRAVRTAYEGGVIPVFASSDYGRAFGELAARHADALGSRTTLLVIGDARSNYQPPNVEALALLKSRAHKLVWLQPESPPSWGFGDSAMRLYEPLCDKVVVAQNLASLRKVVDDLSLS